MPTLNEAPTEADQAEPLDLEQLYREAVIAEAQGYPEAEELTREYLYQKSRTRNDHATIVGRVVARLHAAATLERAAQARTQANELRAQRRDVGASCKEKEAELLAELQTAYKPVTDWDNEHRQTLAKLDAQAAAGRSARETLAATADHADDQEEAELSKRHRKLSFLRDDYGEVLAFSAERRYKPNVEPGSKDCLEVLTKDRAWFVKKGDRQRVEAIDRAEAELPAIRAELEEVSQELAQLQAAKGTTQDWRNFSLTLEA